MTIASNRAILLAAIVYQAIRQYNNNGPFELPPGYKLAAVLGKRKFPYLGFILESGQSIVIALRGTAALSELKKDLQFDQIPFPFIRNAGRTHRGLTELYASALREPMMSYLNKASPKKDCIWPATASAARWSRCARSTSSCTLPSNNP